MAIDTFAELAQLARQLTERAHLLAPGLGDDGLASRARESAKLAFDRALQDEPESYKNMASLFEAIVPDSAPTTRSAAAAKAKQAPTPAIKLDKTPLDALTLDGLDAESVWEQMELRNEAVNSLLGEMFGTGEPNSDEDDDTLDHSDVDLLDDDDDEEGEDEDMIDEDEEDDSEDEDEEHESEEYSSRLNDDIDDKSEEEESEDEEQQPVPLPKKGKKKQQQLSLDNFDDLPASSSKSSKRKGPASEVDDDFFSLEDFHKQTDQGEFEMERALRGEKGGDDDDDDSKEDDFDLFADPSMLPNDDDDEEEEDEGLDEAGIMYNDFFAPPARLPKRAASSKKQQSEQQQRKNKKRKSPSPDTMAVDLEDTEQDESPKTKKAKVRFSDAVRVKTIAPRKQTEFEKLAERIGEAKAREMLGEELVDDEEENYEDDEGDEELEDDEDVDMQDDDEETLDGDEYDEVEEEEDEEDDDDDDVEEDAETIDRFRSDLLADEEEDEEGDKKNLSKQERRLLALSSQIAALEAENVGKKNWATRGEVKSKDRPVNSLLEEDLEFERAGKVVPVITEETTKTIEDLIKRRILDNQFDDVERRRPVDPNAFLPSRYLEVQDTKSGKSLAEIYEEDFVSAKEREAGRKQPANALDADLEKKHREIEDLFDDLSSKLDALSNAHFTPKAPQATITTISNLPAISMESAMPTTQSTATRLAPEEVHVPDRADEDRSDLTPAQKRAERQKRRKERAEAAKKRDRFVSDKEKAKKALLGTRGVTVLGKGGDKTAAAANAGANGKKAKKAHKATSTNSSLSSATNLKL